jgi:hypothetical protein
MPTLCAFGRGDASAAETLRGLISQMIFQMICCNFNLLPLEGSIINIMTSQTSPFFATMPRLDTLAIGLSGLCAVHCVTTAMAVALLSSAAGLLAAPIIHEAGLALAILLGAIALGIGALRHGMMLPVAVGALGLGIMAGALSVPHGSSELVFTLLGVAFVALGHDLNRRALI